MVQCNALQNKKDCVFIKIFIREFHPSFKEDILKTNLLFTNEYQDIPQENIYITKHCRKSLLFNNYQSWKKIKVDPAST